MQYTIAGADRETGEEVQLTVEAKDEAAARAKAAARGLLVADCRAVRASTVRPRAGAPAGKGALGGPGPDVVPAATATADAAATLAAATVGGAAAPAAAPPSNDVGRWLTAAAWASFGWAGLMTLVATLQVAEGGTGLAVWNLAVALGYVLIDVAVLRRRPAAFGWGVGTNAVNIVLGLWQLAADHIPLLVPLPAAEVTIVVFLVFGRPAHSSSWARSIN